ncbi:unnamed protein product [Vitrella brassicaformis CCMP3155]|uniref:Importin N-terminal domain-containing protein n=3 Tax=Vitrella brassicaformis TaxID=1169539 RepID=A0A0G4ECL4_VITBC|nr:unnamed protein product [Vitrella brassicaformis CCMP3155]|eukprot:CEL93478.1 unnamed protein product [Vitrella brassicaformis CCMP3155]
MSWVQYPTEADDGKRVREARDELQRLQHTAPEATCRMYVQVIATMRGDPILTKTAAALCDTVLKRAEGEDDNEAAAAFVLTATQPDARRALLQAFMDETDSSARRAIGHLLTRVRELTSDEWPELLMAMFQLMRSDNEQRAIAAIRVLSAVADTVNEEIERRGEAAAFVAQLRGLLESPSMAIKADAVRLVKEVYEAALLDRDGQRVQMSEYCAGLQSLTPTMQAAVGAAMQSLKTHGKQARSMLETFVQLTEANRFFEQHLLAVAAQFLSIAQSPPSFFNLPKASSILHDEDEDDEDGEEWAEHDHRYLTYEFLISLCEAYPSKCRRIPQFISQLCSLFVDLVTPPASAFEEDGEPEPPPVGSLSDEEVHSDEVDNDDRNDLKVVALEGIGRVAMAVDLKSFLADAWPFFEHKMKMKKLNPRTKAALAEIVAVLFSMEDLCGDDDYHTEYHLGVFRFLLDTCRNRFVNPPPTALRLTGLRALETLLDTHGANLDNNDIDELDKALMPLLTHPNENVVRRALRCVVVQLGESESEAYEAVRPMTEETVFPEVAKTLLHIVQTGTGWSIKQYATRALRQLLPLWAVDACDPRELVESIYASWMPFLKQLLMSPLSPEGQKLKAEVIEAIARLGTKAGFARFHADAVCVLDYLTKTDFPADSPVTDSIVPMLRDMVPALGDSLLPYLSAFWPRVMAPLDTRPKPIKSDDVDSEEKQQQQRQQTQTRCCSSNETGQIVSLGVDEIEEISRSADLLALVLNRFGDRIPHQMLTEIFQHLRNVMTLPFDEVMGQGQHVLQAYLKTLRQMADRRSPAGQQQPALLLQEVGAYQWQAIQWILNDIKKQGASDRDEFLINRQVAALTVALEAPGKDTLTQQQVLLLSDWLLERFHVSIDQIKQKIRQSLTRKSRKTEADVHKEAEEELTSLRKCRVTLVPCLSRLISTHTSHFDATDCLSRWARVLQALLASADESSSYQELLKLALHLFKHYTPDRPHWSALLPLVVSFLSSTQPQLRKRAAHIILLASAHPALGPHLPQCVPQLLANSIPPTATAQQPENVHEGPNGSVSSSSAMENGEMTESRESTPEKPKREGKEARMAREASQACLVAVCVRHVGGGFVTDELAREATDSLLGQGVSSAAPFYNFGGCFAHPSEVTDDFYRFLVDAVQQGNVYVLDPNHSRLPRLVKIFRAIVGRRKHSAPDLDERLSSFFNSPAVAPIVAQIGGERGESSASAEVLSTIG